MLQSKIPALAALLYAILIPINFAYAQTGVSDDRVSLPEGPGSVDGFGDNARSGGNMGFMTTQVPIEVPAGFAGMIPNLGLNYSSSSGNGWVGLGWSLPIPAVERTTVRGLPTYDADDGFSAGGGDLLVALPNTQPPEYRARKEGAFVRYRWHNRGDGSQGYFTAELPDGSIGYFGADALGNLVDEARVPGSKGTFRYLLHEKVDPFGHRLEYTYSPQGNARRLQSVGYLFDTNGTPRHRIDFAYQTRPDVISDAKSGVEEHIAERLSQVTVFAHQTAIRTYTLQYQDNAQSQAISRLIQVASTAQDGSPYPAAHSFTYVGGLVQGCSALHCQKASLTQIEGALSIDLQAGRATLVDLNGDALPDIVDTSLDGEPHRIWLAELDADGTQRFVGPTPSSIGTAGGHDLGSPHVHVLDTNGDGLADLLNNATGKVLLNRATGDWTETQDLLAVGGQPNLAEDGLADTGEPTHFRFFDYDNDKRIDLIRSLTDSTSIFSRSENGGFAPLPGNAVDTLEAGFATDNMQLADMNGDGLLDPLIVRENDVSYRIYLGLGRWTDWRSDTSIELPAADVPWVQIEDLNGDDLSDLVIVRPSSVDYALARSVAGDAAAPSRIRFDAWRSIANIDNTSVPERTPQTTVLFADMNGSGSTDIVWIDGGQVTYLELFPVPPGLLERIENGLGQITDVRYASSITQRAQSTRPWKHILPHPMTVVVGLDTYDTLTDLHRVESFSYADGRYDGEEKQFRGFAEVAVRTAGDDFQEASTTLTEYSVGDLDRDAFGQPLRVVESSGERILQETSRTFDDCTVADIPASQTLTFPVRYLCLARQETVLKEGQPQSSWQTLARTWVYDGYGNAIEETNLGRIDAASGEDILGDESFVFRDFIPPQAQMGTWMLRKTSSERLFGERNGAIFSERRIYYDGAPFEGLPLGQITQGKVRKIEELAQAGEYVALTRHDHDSHGNPITALDALAEDAQSDHRRTWGFDPTGLRVVRSQIHLKDSNDAARVLQRDIALDPVWLRPLSVSHWQIADPNAASVPPDAASLPRSIHYRWDALGRLEKIIQPGGDNEQSPTEEYAYIHDQPSHSHVDIFGRSQVGEAFDQHTVRCYDGRGRIFQERVQTAANQYQVSGFTQHNVAGAPARIYQPYASASAACDTQAPEDVLHTDIVRDGLGRILEVRSPDSSIYPSASVLRRVYAPLQITVHDPEDVAPTHDAPPAPRMEYRDGQDRLISIEEPTGTGETLTTSIAYDSLGNLAGYTDPAGNTLLQVYDRRGLVLRVDHPDRGQERYDYDASGNKIRAIDARGVVVAYTYDGANRLLREGPQGATDAQTIRYTYDAVDTQGGLLDASACANCTNLEGELAEVAYPLAPLVSETGAETSTATPSAVGVDRMGYDARGNGTHLERHFRGWHAVADQSFVLKSHFDNSSRYIGVDYPDGLGVRHTLDRGGRVAAVPGVVDAIQYDDRGDLAQIRYTNGSQTEHTFDVLQRLVGIKVSATAGQSDGVSLKQTLARDRRGFLMQIDRDGRLVGQESQRFAYDGLGRMLEAKLSQSQATAEVFDETLTYRYDALHNIVGKTSSQGSVSKAHVGDYRYGEGLVSESAAGPHAVVQAGDKVFAYDASGNMQKRGAQTLHWDFRGRLTAVENASPLGQTQGSPTVARFAYGASQDRVAKRVDGQTVFYISPGYEVRDGHGVAYVRLGGQRIAKITRAQGDSSLDASNAPYLAWQAGQQALAAADPSRAVDAQAVSSAMLAAAARGLLLAERTASSPDLAPAPVAITALHLDHLGTVLAASDASGLQIHSSHTYPYGMARGRLRGMAEDQAFTGKETDASTGLIYFGARYADPHLARFISADTTFTSVVDEVPFSRPDEATGSYVYLVNSPSNVRDDDGRFVANVVGAVAGFTVGWASEAVRAHHVEGKTWKQAFFSGNAALAAGIGAVTGGLSGGLSVVSTVAGTAATVASYKVYERKLLREAQASGGVPRANDVARAQFKAALWGIGVGGALGAGTGIAGQLAGFTPSADLASAAGLAASGTSKTVVQIVSSSLGSAGLAGAAKAAWKRRGRNREIRQNNRNHAQNVGTGRRSIARGAAKEVKRRKKKKGGRAATGGGTGGGGATKG